MRGRKTIKYAVCAFFVLLFCALITFSAEASVPQKVYLKDGGTGDGSSPSAAVGSFRDAVKLLKHSGGKLIICGKYTVTELVNLSVMGGTSNGNNIITVTSLDGSHDYRETDNAMLCFGDGKESANMILAGKFVFEELNIVTNGTDKARAIICGGYDTVFGEGIVCKKQGDAPYISVIGVSLDDADAQNGSGMLVIRSGTYNDVCAGNRDNGVKGYTTLIIHGGMFEGRVSATSVVGQTEQQGGAELTVYGGVFNGPVGAIGGVDGGFIFVVNGGTFKKSIYALGKHNVIDINGGNMQNLSLLKIADVIVKAPETDEKGETVDEGDDRVNYSVVNINSYDWDVDTLVRKIEGQGVLINKNTEGGQGIETLPALSETMGETDIEPDESLPNESEQIEESKENGRGYFLGTKSRTLTVITLLVAISAVAIVILSYRAVYRKK
ncbi:MAG: hypothetical protein E7615_00335 [Ruminococcaceae bacterium]|nr:hypothetical protein [Oscillospiraceae bacterium]